MFSNKIKDDSKEVIQHYKKVFAGEANNKILSNIIELMNSWSKILNRGKIENEEKELFLEALTDKNESIWFEAGSRLALLLKKDENIKEIFDTVFNDKRVNCRFNIVALCKYFDKDYAESILSKAINDKSNKIRNKSADEILKMQDKKILSLAKERLKIETDKKVSLNLQFVIDNFNKVKIDEDGSISLSI